jgi:hypothetical protein
MRHVYGSRFAETDEERLLRQDIVELQREVERWRQIAQQTPVPIVVEHGDNTEIIGQTNLILQAERSKLRSAIRTLVQAHTRDDPRVGYTVSSMADDLHMRFNQQEYIEAWGTLRKELHEQTEPDR